MIRKTRAIIIIVIIIMIIIIIVIFIYINYNITTMRPHCDGRTCMVGEIFHFKQIRLRESSDGGDILDVVSAEVLCPDSWDLPYHPHIA